MITLDPDQYAATLSDAVRSADALYSVQYAITYRCNVACSHCYAEGAGDGAPPELGISEVRDLFQQFAAEGCLHCTVTGGEPLARPEFETLWTVIAEQGIRRLLFTNATLVDDRKAAFLRDIPPDWVEVSLYGADERTHDAVTRVPGSFEATLAGIRWLKAAGLRVRAKTVVMRSNVDQLAAIAALARTIGDGSFRLDGQLIRSFTGELDVEPLRVSPDAFAEAEAKYGRGTMDAWCHEIDRLKGHVRKQLYGCGAARGSVYLSPWGALHPCLCAAHRQVSLRQMRVADALATLRAGLAAELLPQDHPCRGCPSQPLCQNCAAAAQLEVGDERGVSPYRCAVAKKRLSMYTARHNEG